MTRILLVDDERNVLNALKRALREEPYELEDYTDAGRALERAREQQFDLVVSDYRMPVMDGIGFLLEFKQIQPDCARLILSGYADLGVLMDAINEAEIYRFIAKPWHDDELKSAMAQALWVSAVQLENRRLADEVRRQQGEIVRQRAELARLEAQHPGITRVNWGPDGSILMDGSDL